MGRKSKKKGGKGNGGGDGGDSPGNVPAGVDPATAAAQIGDDPDSLLAMGMTLASQTDHANAIPHLRKAIEQDPSRTDIIDVLAECLAHVGDRDAAVEALMESARRAPNENPAKYFYLGQLHDGRDAVTFYRSGIEALAARGVELEGKLAAGAGAGTGGDGETAAQLAADMSAVRHQSAAAHCSIVEIFMSDLCDEPEAEQESENNVARALELAPDIPDPWLAKANLCVVQHKKDEALDAVRRSVACWAGAVKANDGDGDGDKTNGDSGNGNDDGDDDDDDDDGVDRPSIDVRFSTARLFMELEQPADAAEVLETILEEEDTVPDIWYLYGEALVEAKDPDHSSALDAFRNAGGLFAKSGLDVESQVIQTITSRIAVLEPLVAAAAEANP